MRVVSVIREGGPGARYPGDPSAGEDDDFYDF